MLHLTVTDGKEAITRMVNVQDQYVVSLIGPDFRYAFPNLNALGLHHLIRTFHDIEGPAAAMDGAILPTVEDIRAVFEFTKDIPDEARVHVHCHAGRSRSVAMAIGIMIQHGLTVTEAFLYMISQRFQAMPNRLMIRMIDEELQLNGELIEITRAYYSVIHFPGVILREQTSGWTIPATGDNKDFTESSRD